MIKNKEQLQEKKQHVLNSFNNSICFVMKVWFTYHIYKINFASELLSISYNQILLLAPKIE